MNFGYLEVVLHTLIFNQIVDYLYHQYYLML